MRDSTKYRITRVCKHIRMCTIRVYVHGDICKRTHMITTHELSIHYGWIQFYYLPYRNSLFTFDFPRPFRPKGFIRKSNPSDRRTLIRTYTYMFPFFFRLRWSLHVEKMNSVLTLIIVSFSFYFFQSIAEIRSLTNVHDWPCTADAFIQLKYYFTSQFEDDAYTSDIRNDVM